MKTAKEVAELFWQYRADDHDVKLRMRQVANNVDGTVVIPLPELNAIDKPAVANLTYKGIQAMGQRFASTQPDVTFLPTKLTKEAKKAATLQTRRVQFWWQQDKMPLLDAQAGRYMFGYGTAPVRMDIDLVAGRTFVSQPSPLGIYVPRPKQVNDLRPEHGIAARQMPVASILAAWPNNLELKLSLRECKPHEQRWVLEYADAVQVTLVMCGEADLSNIDFASIDQRGEPVTLSTAPNRAEMSPWVAPGLVNLNKPQGHFDQIMGMYQAQGLLTALELQQAARSVFPETWIVSRQGENAQVVTAADPMRGVAGEIRGGDIQTIVPPPQYSTNLTQDRLAAAQRETAGIPAEFSGMAASNVRTGRRANQLVDAAVDPSLGESQTMWAMAKEEMIKIGAAYERGYLKKSRTFAVKFGGRKAAYEATPADIWKDGCEPFVQYPMAGSDVNSLAILTMQEMGGGLISKETARKRMPDIDDPEGEKDQIAAEQLEAVFLESLAAMVQDPQSPLQPRHLPVLIKKIRDKDIDPVDAFLEIQAEEQERQAEQVEAGTPEAMQGLDGAGAVPPAIAGPAPAQQNLASLMSSLRLPERTIQTSSGGRA